MHTLTGNDAATLTVNDRQQAGGRDDRQLSIVIRIQGTPIADYERFGIGRSCGWLGADQPVLAAMPPGGWWRVRLGPQSASPLTEVVLAVAGSCGALTRRVPGSAAGLAGRGEARAGPGEDALYRTHIWSSRGP